MLRFLTILGALNTIVFGLLAIFVGGEGFQTYVIATMVSGAFMAVLITLKMINATKGEIDVSRHTWTSGDGGGGG